MRFNLIDRIVEVQAGKQLQAFKNLTLGEEYLADHFPSFPVMPGVMMLQAVVETAAWLLRLTEDFRYSIIVLREARNVKYGSFMEPGRQMRLTVDLQESDATTATFKGKGECEGQTTVSARLTLTRYNLRDRNPLWQATDERLIAYYRELLLLLQPVPAGSPCVTQDKGSTS